MHGFLSGLRHVLFAKPIDCLSEQTSLFIQSVGCADDGLILLRE
jgi:hypothetical protein